LGKHTQGYVLQAGDYPRYFDAIRTQSRIAAGDARIDLRTSEFAQGYLIPLGIASMLDAVLFLEGGVAGVVCFEHTGEKREWHPDEESFATAIASLMTQAITNASRKRAENALRESEERLRRAVLCAPLPIMIHAEDGEVILISDAWTEITGYSHAEIPSIADWTERACGHRKELVRRI
jgi:GAF domain-containing protein